MPRAEIDPLEEALTRAGREQPYPRTPPLAARARAALDAPPRRARFGLLSGLASAALALIVALTAVVMYRGQQVASPPLPARAYSVNLLGGDLSVVDIEREQLVGQIAVGSNPWGIARTQNGARLYVAVDGGVAVVDTARGERVDFIATSADYKRAKVAISAEERILLVASPSRLMRLIDLPTRGTLNEFAIELVPYDIKLSRDGRFAYLLSETDGSLTIVDVRAGRTIARLTFGGSYRGYFMAQSPDGRWLYVPRLAKSEMWIVDTQANEARVVSTESKAHWQASNGSGTERGVTVSPDGSRLYVATADDAGGGVSVLDTQNFKEIARANTASGFFGAALSPDGSKLLLTVPETHQLTILDARTLQLITSIPVGQSPFRVLVTP